jgi:hypothetical protein
MLPIVGSAYSHNWRATKNENALIDTETSNPLNKVFTLTDESDRCDVNDLFT